MVKWLIYPLGIVCSCYIPLLRLFFGSQHDCHHSLDPAAVLDTFLWITHNVLFRKTDGVILPIISEYNDLRYRYSLPMHKHVRYLHLLIWTWCNNVIVIFISYKVVVVVLVAENSSINIIGLYFVSLNICPT